MPALLADKIAVITGGTEGIGLATAHRFVEEGATVFITGRRQAELDSAVEALGERAIGVQGDVAVADDVDRLYAAVAAHGRGLDVVFANAGTAPVATLATVTDDHLDTVLATNIKGTVYTVQRALPLLNDGASIILNSSTTGERGRIGLGVYAASKAALRSLARTWANELAARNVRVNAVVPGYTATPGIERLARAATPDSDTDGFRAAASTSIPLGRFGEPRETANVVVFLASELSSYTTGAAVPVDGGMNQV
ncbi:short-chain dehydrogenase [Mycobacteroides sp. H001]|uniref:SDR family NAD(P)-dependent oxidoreductase n=1 Tax=unclassified Mycobacteroides TaxID=2618759 RepID=UPI0007137027|nr:MULTISPECIES: SDR family oxidoreductase [unclassified Mycobacteroides]KRQ20431.1 short-chain dehydrogenase [Mycobacteroides sp. H072]KRQ34287.1 short-chain dehydrogenase [Mycobacteroides sp. H002]KRQ52148.1 short-chain dehydrogenase [Mycobacteroides sp. H054]KRQ71701.1 short-chain dehydrogenase [Mycobacteroides sp. H001]